jgi:prephenate dehydrogenase
MDNVDRATDGNPAQKPFARAGVIGLGLIGGSIARSLQCKAGIPVVGLDIDRAVIDAAISQNVLDCGGVISPDDSCAAVVDRQAWQLLHDCEVVFICAPAQAVPRLVRLAADFCPGLLTDVASVKQPIMDQVAPDRFVGGHPMAGSERQGFQFSSETLLENAVYVLCLHPETQLAYATLRKFEALIRLIGATPVILDAAEHDRAVAAVSHLPHVAASALSLFAARSDEGSLTRLAAGGFRDITRIASSDPLLWAGISLDSRRCLLPALRDYIAILNEYARAIDEKDQTALHRLFYQAAQYRNNLPVDGRGALVAHSMLTVYVSDKPGVLGHVTTLLGENGINISNIRIKELRTYEGGCLQLMLPDGNQAVKAAWLLKEAGYVCD